MNLGEPRGVESQCCVVEELSTRISDLATVLGESTTCLNFLVSKLGLRAMLTHM